MLLLPDMNTKEKYKEFSLQQPSFPLFLSGDWMDAVTGGKWDVVLEERGGEVLGSLVFYLSNRKGFSLIGMPPLTPYSGLWLKYPEGQKYNTRLSYEKEIVQSLISKLPASDRFEMHFHPSIINWQPFHWQGFEQSTRYTYMLDASLTREEIFEGFKENIRREIRKAEKELRISVSDDIKQIYDLKKKSYQTGGRTLHLSAEIPWKIQELCKASGSGKILIASDDHENIHAGICIVWDNTTCYYLFGASEPAYKSSGAMSLLLWEAIKMAGAMGRSFDFEGSMVEPVEQFFRAFGGRQVPYFRIHKTNSFLLRLMSFLTHK